MNVLLLDKDKKRLKTLVDTLGDQDFNIVVEKDGKEVMKHLLDDPPELIISDFELPGGGIDLVNNILTLTKDQYPYVLFLTEEEEENYAVDSLGPIPGDFLLKPLKKRELKARIAVAERTIALQSHLRDSKGGRVDLALYDDMTNVLNRQAVYERALAELNRAMREKIQVCLAMIEVINHKDMESDDKEDMSAQAIRYVARAIRANVRMYDLVGRWIGSKFFLLLPSLPKEHTQAVIERIYTAITAVRVKYGEGEMLPIDIAIGYTWSTEEAPAPLYVLIEQANNALNEASKIEEGNRTAAHQVEKQKG